MSIPVHLASNNLHVVWSFIAIHSRTLFVPGSGRLLLQALFPIIFLHTGVLSILTWSLFQARSSNPSAGIILLGDRSNHGVSKYFQQHSMSHYFSSAKEFGAVYKHMSPNSYSFELRCFQRWFVLLEFMRQQGMSHCVVADSDVMIYSELESLQNRYRHADLAMRGWGAHFVFINSVEGLERFCGYCLDLYRRDDYLQRLADNFASFAPGMGGNCDMTAFHWYEHEFPERVAQIGGIHDDATFDHAVGKPGGFEMQDGRKKIVWRDDLPYGYHCDLERLIRFHTLHFQGAAKEFMPAHYRGSPIPNDFRIESAGYHLYQKARQIAKGAVAGFSIPS